jgi:hypothetical protein
MHRMGSKKCPSSGHAVARPSSSALPEVKCDFYNAPLAEWDAAWEDYKRRAAAHVQGFIATRKQEKGWWEMDTRGAGGTVEPTCADDRLRFYTAPIPVQRQVTQLSAELYDGTRTVAVCWKEALAQMGLR